MKTEVECILFSTVLSLIASANEQLVSDVQILVELMNALMVLVNSPQSMEHILIVNTEIKDIKHMVHGLYNSL
jgi:ethanolamine utilization cobalamin adenosyltransferase